MSISAEINNSGVTIGDEYYGRTENGYGMHSESIYMSKEEAIELSFKILSAYKVEEKTSD